MGRCCDKCLKKCKFKKSRCTLPKTVLSGDPQWTVVTEMNEEAEEIEKVKKDKR